MNAFSSSDSPMPLQPLADVDERRDGRVLRPADLGDPRADVRRGHRLRRDVAGVPVVLVPRVEDVPQVGDDVRADQRAPVHHLGDVLQPLRDLDVVDRPCRWPGRCRGSSPTGRRPRTACSAWDRTSRARPCRRPSRAGCSVSAVGSGCLSGSAPRTGRGSPAARAASAAALMPRRKSRRLQVASGMRDRRAIDCHRAFALLYRISWNSGSMNTTQSRSARPSGVGGRADELAGRRQFVGRGPAAQGPQVDRVDQLVGRRLRLRLEQARRRRAARCRRRSGRWTGRGPAASSASRRAW